MREMNNIEYSFMVEELHATISSKYFDNIYDLGSRRLRLKLGSEHIMIHLGKHLNLAKYIEEAEGTSRFSQKVKKELEGAKLSEIYQYKKDRIVVFVFQPRGSCDRLLLIFEMFGDGNCILVKDGIILSVYEEREWSGRKLKHGEIYHFPKSENPETLLSVLSNHYIISCLLKLPYGKEYMKDVLARCRIEEKRPGNTLNKDEILCLTHGIHEIESAKKPLGFYDKGVLVDFGLIPFVKYSSLETKEFKTLSEVIDEYYFNIEEKKSSVLEKLERRLGEQCSRLTQLKMEEEEKKRIGDFIYENYEKIEKILAIANASKIDELEERLRPYAAKVDKKNKTIEIEI